MNPDSKALRALAGLTRAEKDPGAVTASDVPDNSADSLSTSEDLLHVDRLLTLGELSACFAHEVSNPLTMIRGNLRIINESIDAEHSVRASLEAIESASTRIEDMAHRMLVFSSRYVSRHESCDIAKVVSEALHFLKPYFKNKNTTSRIDIAPGLPPINGDRGQIVQALVNLFKNAAEAMADCDSRYLTVTVTRVATHIRIAIRDTGSGISKDDIERVFSPFFTTKGEHGTGLGLYITKRIVEEHGGEISVQSDASGTKFVLSLPIQV